MLAGYAIVLAHAFINFLGKSPGTIPCGFLALYILLSTALTDSLGLNVWSLVPNQVLTLGGNLETSSGENS